MTTLMPRDADNAPIPALRLRPGGAHTLAVTAASTRISTPFGENVRVVQLYATGPVFLRTGGAEVVAEAGDHHLPAGIVVTIALGSPKTGLHSHLAAIRAGGDCTLYISELE